MSKSRNTKIKIDTLKEFKDERNWLERPKADELLLDKMEEDKEEQKQLRKELNKQRKKRKQNGIKHSRGAVEIGIESVTGS